MLYQQFRIRNRILSPAPSRRRFRQFTQGITVAIVTFIALPHEIRALLSCGPIILRMQMFWIGNQRM